MDATNQPKTKLGKETMKKQLKYTGAEFHFTKNDNATETVQTPREKTEQAPVPPHVEKPVVEAPKPEAEPTTATKTEEVAKPKKKLQLKAATQSFHIGNKSSTSEPFKPSTSEPFKPSTSEPFKPTQTSEPFKPTQTSEPFKPAQTSEPFKPAQTTENPSTTSLANKQSQGSSSFQKSSQQGQNPQQIGFVPNQQVFNPNAIGMNATMVGQQQQIMGQQQSNMVTSPQMIQQQIQMLVIQNGQCMQVLTQAQQQGNVAMYQQVQYQMQQIQMNMMLLNQKYQQVSGSQGQGHYQQQQQQQNQQQQQTQQQGSDSNKDQEKSQVDLNKDQKKSEEEKSNDVVAKTEEPKSEVKAVAENNQQQSTTSEKSPLKKPVDSLPKKEAEDQKQASPKKEENEKATVEAPIVEECKPVEEESDKQAEERIREQDEEKARKEKEYVESLPIERPTEIRYTKAMVLAFIQKEVNKDLPNDMMHYLREITYEQKKKDKRGGPMSGGMMNRGGGKKDDHKGFARKGENNSFKKGGFNTPKGGDLSLKNTSSVMSSSSNTQQITRQVWNAEQRQRVEAIQSTADKFITDHNQIGEKDVRKKILSEIRLKLFAITAENYDDILIELTEYCKDYDIVSDMIEMLIERAWTQPKFTKLYAKLTCELGNKDYEWKLDEKLQAQGGSKNQFKTMVINLIRKEFFSGFGNFKKYMLEIEANEKMDEQEKFEKYLKKKLRLMGNMSFIAELFLLKYLPLKVMRFITYNLVYQFTKHLLDENKVSEKLKIEEEYLEALIKLFEASGQKVEEREKNEVKKTSKFDGIVDQFLCSLNLAVLEQNFDDDLLSKIISEDQKKDINCMNMAMKFLENCLECNLSVRINSLIQNLFDRRNTGWKDNIYSNNGPKKLADIAEDQRSKANTNQRGGGSRYEKGNDDDDYYSSKAHHKAKRAHEYEDEDEYQAVDKNEDADGGRGGKYNKGSRHGGSHRDVYQKRNSNSTRTRDDEDYESKKIKTGGSSNYEKSETFSKFYRQSHTTDNTEGLSLRKNLSKKSAMGNQDEKEFKINEEEMEKLLVEFVKTQKSCDDIEVYKQWFEETESDWKDTTNNACEKLMRIYINNYHDCHLKSAIVRAKMVPHLYKIHKNSKPSHFTVPFCIFVGKMAAEDMFEDIPHLPKSLSMMMYSMMEELKDSIKVEDFVWEWNNDEDVADCQLSAYIDMLEQLKKLYEGNKERCDEIDTYKKTIKRPE